MWLEYLAETVAGITVMTAFSYVISVSFRKLFAEPVLLNYVICLLHITIKPKMESALGWVLHYVIGAVFVVIYHVIWNLRLLNDDWLTGIMLGAGSGVIGILGWMIIFSLPPKKPRVAFSQYYIQLFFAHIFFALPIVAVHHLFE
jgi:hypothetical protein